MEEAARILTGAGHGVTCVPTRAPGSATEQVGGALTAGADLILACGGDGTINEVANGMIGSVVPLGILPAGTANVLSMETGQGSNLVSAAARIGSLVPRQISVGRVSQPNNVPRHFLLMPD